MLKKRKMPKRKGTSNSEPIFNTNTEKKEKSHDDIKQKHKVKKEKKKRVLTEEQKAKMAEGRKKRWEELHDGEAMPEKEVSNKYKGPLVVGYSMEDGDEHPYPVFYTERKNYKGKISPTKEEARQVYQEMLSQRKVEHSSMADPKRVKEKHR